ncbi:glutamate receptor ionotropic, kainate 5-like [Haliotis asinina]|uniref:glutamate receptor ionotropic, kainate 5-like n=1 Tax=Haliotis asinina TaxID=109174 RepID=UPI003531A011
MLVQLLMSLNWQSVLVLHERELDVQFGSSLETAGIFYVDYDISFSTEEHIITILSDVEKVFMPELNMLLLCDVTNTVSVLRQMTRFCGTRSKSSADLCHVSRLLIVGTSHDLPVLLDSNIQVENLAVLEPPSSEEMLFTRARMWTLMFHPNGRAFTDVNICETVINPVQVFPNIKFGYNGRQFTVVMKTNDFGYGYLVVGKRKLFGFPYRVLNLLAETMNFSYRIIPPREDDWGKNINGSWTGIFGMLQRREADLASDMLTIHTNRSTVSDYILPPVAESKQMILYKKEQDADEDHLLILLRPFQPQVFIVLGVSVIIYIIFLSSLRFLRGRFQMNSHVTSQCKNVHPNVRSGNVCHTANWTTQATTSTAFEICGAILKQGSNVESSDHSERILVAGWWMFTTVISAVYCGTIMAIFAVKLEKPPFSNMAELAAREDYKTGYDSSSILENLLQFSKQSDVMAMRQRVQDLSTRDHDVLSSNTTKHLQKVWDGKYAFLGGTFLSAIRHTNCKLKVIDTTFESSFTAFHLPKSSPFKKDFQNSMYLLSESGVLQRTYHEWFASTEDDGCPVEDYPKPLSLVKVLGVFFAAGAGLICSLLMLLAEIVWYKMKQKPPQR